MAYMPCPEIPPEIVNAAQTGELVVFVGNGISRLINCPSWDGFADKVLQQLVPSCMNHYDLSQINTIADPRKRLSIAKILAKKKGVAIDYATVFEVTLKEGHIYSYLNSFDCSFVTTNYEKNLRPASRVAEPEEQWRFYRRAQLLGGNLDRNGNVLHLHGCVDDPETMIITTKDYLEHYSTEEVQGFLRYLFEKKTVLFLGYGLEEVEILEYILRRGRAGKEERLRRFILQGFFDAENTLFDSLNEYYLEAFTTKLIRFPKDEKSYAQQTEILAAWSVKLTFGGMTVTDEVRELEEEIRG